MRLGFLTRWLWGDQAERPTYFLTRWLFFRLLGVIYFIAFVSLGNQIQGLVGSSGILSAAELLQRISEQLGPEKYRIFPTLVWLHSSDGFLLFLWCAGAFLSMLLLMGLTSAFILFLLWLFYLSLFTVCREFLGFQWDILLLETGFLAIFLAPYYLWPSRKPEPPSRMVLWLFRLLLFKLMFSSGMVKLASGDPSWHNLEALFYHYETQPLPTWIGWYAHQLPHWFQKISVVCVFIIQLGVSFLIFAPRQLRFFCCWVNVGFQVLIILTGNYTFFNLLAITLCLMLLDDAWLRRFLPRGIASRLSADNFRAQEPILKKVAVGALAAVVLLITTFHISKLFVGQVQLSAPAQVAFNWLRPFQLVNGYGLFAVMTKSRPEIIVEGSNDRKTWLEYGFKWKPGDLNRAPVFVAPYQPRLDWQMWFAALSNYQRNPWFIHFLSRLLEGSQSVLSLLEKNPFPDAPPRYIRAVLYDYRFANISTQRANGQWWWRERKKPYTPVLQLPASR